MDCSCSSRVPRSQSHSGAQKSVPTRITGTQHSILPVWMRTSTSKSSSRVPNPPGKKT